MWRHLIPFMTVSALALGACSGGGSASGCDSAFQERLDPASDLHVLDGTEVEYLTDPPTSGPHGAVNVPDGLIDAPLARSTQVAVLESGRVLVQYADDVSEAEVAELAGMAESGVVIAPNPALEQPLVLTAWTWKMECPGVTADVVADIEAFATQRIADAPGSDFDPPVS